MLILSIIDFSRMEQMVEYELGRSYEQLAGQYMNSLEYKIDLYRNLMDNISMNYTLQEILSQENNLSVYDTFNVSEEVSDQINSLLSLKNANEIYNIMIYAYRPDFPSDGKHVNNVDNVKDEMWFQNNTASDSFNDKYTFYTTDALKTPLIAFTKDIVNFFGGQYYQKLAVVKLDIHTERFFNIKKSADNQVVDNFIVLDKNQRIIYNSNKGISVENLNEIMLNIPDDFGTQKVNVSNEKAVMIYNNLEYFDWEFVFLFDYDEIEKKTFEIKRKIRINVYIILAFVIIATILFSRTITKPISFLVTKMKKVEKGDLAVTGTISRKDEIGMLDGQFNKMISRIDELIKKNYIQELNKREAELNALQIQINPHFLYNTLESINAIASVYKCFEVCEITQKLGEMFRYNISPGKSEYTTVINEIKHIRNYVHIQKIRFKDSFETVYDIEKSVKEYKTMKFILQPIVENAIYHAFEPSCEKGMLEISAYKSGECLMFKIQDDGIGMSQEKLDSLNEYINKTDDNMLSGYKKGIGIRNVNMRIKLAFGNDFGLSIKSNLNSGTTVLIKLPVINQCGRDSDV